MLRWQSPRATTDGPSHIINIGKKIMWPEISDLHALVLSKIICLALGVVARISVMVCP